MKHAWVVLAITGCTVDSTASRESAIIGPSHAALAGELPATGALLSDALGFPSLHCTATLIAQNALLTAAHCVNGSELPTFTFERYAYQPPVASIHAVSAMYAHPDFDGNVPLGELVRANDIGLAILAEPILDVAPVLLPRPADGVELVVDLPVTLAGYGLADDYDHDAGVPGYEYKRVGTTHVTQVATYEIAIASAGEAGACNGDSGGPAYAMLGNAQRIAATVSRGLGFMDCTRGGVFTRVDPYIEWIESHVVLPCGSGNSPACAGGDAGTGSDMPPSDDPGDPGNPPDEPAGCGCRTHQPTGSWLVIVVALGLSRRKRRSR